MVVFCTAYDEYLLDALGQNGIAYLLKPYSAATLVERIGLARGPLEQAEVRKLPHVLARILGQDARSVGEPQHGAAPGVQGHHGEAGIAVAVLVGAVEEQLGLAAGAHHPHRRQQGRALRLRHLLADGRHRALRSVHRDLLRPR